MKSITTSNKTVSYIIKDKINYTLNETCPHCGAYTPDGQVCNNCLKKFDLYEYKNNL